MSTFKPAGFFMRDPAGGALDRRSLLARDSSLVPLAPGPVTDLVAAAQSTTTVLLEFTAAARATGYHNTFFFFFLCTCTHS